MQDNRLGSSVETPYTGFLIDGKPLHSGNCFDGVYGCGLCARALKLLPDDQLQELGVSLEGYCEWCKGKKSFRDIVRVTTFDDHCTYEVCTPCKDRYEKAIEEKIRNKKDLDWNEDW